MAAMLTPLVEFSDSVNSRVWSTTGNTTALKRQVMQRRRVPVGNQVVAEDTITVVYSALDAESNILQQKITFTVTIKQPIHGDTTSRDAALATFRDIVAGDEFANTVATQEYLK